MSEKVDHPVHYGGADNLYEHIKVVEAWGLGYNLGNATKYICRSGKKSLDPLEDLKKAQFYLNREVASLEAANANIQPSYERDMQRAREVMRQEKPLFRTTGPLEDVRVPAHPEILCAWRERGGDAILRCSAFRLPDSEYCPVHARMNLEGIER